MTYAVILQYPGDGQLEENRVEFFRNAVDAVTWRDNQGDPDLKVFRVEPVNESALWDWGTTYDGSDTEPMHWVNERTARSCLRPNGKLVKRRLGTSEWIEVAQ